MKNPLITMSAITGNPTKEEIYDYMEKLNTNGIEQVMLYPRVGCEIEYLSDEWFEKIGEFIKTAEQLDMNVWLYDEFNWPSGDAGGRVTKFEEFRLKAVTVKGENMGEIRRLSTHNSALFGEKYFPDLLSEKAVEYFVACTHEKYYEKFGAYFGNIIKGIFTDEPSMGYCCPENSLPYYDGMENDYKECFGRDFMEDMENANELFCQNAVALIADRFHHCFIKKIDDRCKAHHILMTGHLMEDHQPFAATRYNGDLLRNLSSFSLPGIDEIRTDFTESFLLSLFGAAEYASGEHGAMAELFALGPCDMSYTTKRCMIFFAACFKINHYFLAVSHMDLRGNRKIRDYFNDFSADQPDFKGTLLLAKDAKLAAQYAKKDFTPDVYVRYPTELCAKHITDNFNMEAFTNLLNRLSFYQLQWKFAAEEEDCGNIPVIEFNDKLAYCLNGTVTSDVEVICGMFQKEIAVTDVQGNIPQGIFVRKFNDKTLAVLNLYGKAGTYKVNGNEIELEQHGIYIGTSVPENSLPGQKEKLSASFQIHYDNENMIRTMHVNGKLPLSEIHTDSDRMVHFAVSPAKKCQEVK